MLEVVGLGKSYGGRVALDGVSFRAVEGCTLGLLGPNGAGKTTTMRVITGYMPPTEGRVIVAGFDVFDQPIEAKRRMGYLPETPPLYPDMTVREYLDFVAKIKGVPSGERRARAVDPHVAADGGALVATNSVLVDRRGTGLLLVFFFVVFPVRVRPAPGTQTSRVKVRPHTRVQVHGLHYRVSLAVNGVLHESSLPPHLTPGHRPLTLLTPLTLLLLNA